MALVKKNKKSPLWEYFDINSESNKLAICLLCNVNISRGGEGKKVGMYLIINSDNLIAIIFLSSKIISCKFADYHFFRYFSIGIALMTVVAMKLWLF